MEPDCYKVDILHYLNPHLIWVEVLNSESNEEFAFEQIGIYGLVPFETTIEIDALSESSLKGQRCPQWVPAAAVIMKNCLSSAKKVLFQPTLFDRRSSIFDDNIHKYGELIVKTSDGKRLKMSKVLCESGFASYDVCKFHKELSQGELKTKLSNNQIREIVKVLEGDVKSSDKNRKRKVKKQTTVFHASQNFETTLTVQNLERHNKQMKGIEIDKLVQKKMKDFDKCKDIEEESIGRAYNSKQTPEKNNKMPSSLKKKLEHYENKKTQSFENGFSNAKDPMEILIATKKFLEANAKVESTNSNISDKNEVVLNSKNIDYVNINKEPKDQCPQTDFINVPDTASENKKDTESKHEDVKKASVIFPQMYKEIGKRVKKHTKPNKIPKYNMSTEKLVAYGPPDLDRMRLPCKVISKEDKDEVVPPKPVDNRVEENSTGKELYADVDSNVNLVITNNDYLKSTLKEINESDNVDSNSLSDNKENTTCNKSYDSDELRVENKSNSRLSVLQKKLKLHQDMISKKSDSFVTSDSDTTNKDSSSSAIESRTKKERKKSETLVCDYLNPEADVTEVMEKINAEYPLTSLKKNKEPKNIAKAINEYKTNVNPFKNVDECISVFVDKLVSPVLMVHSKKDKRIEPCANMQDVNFNTNIHIVLKNISVERPMILQMISWPVILRGYSLFMVSPRGSGKTLGYLPAVCRHITDFHTEKLDGVGPTCIIVCATAQSVSEVYKLARMFMELEERVFSCYAGMDELHITTSLLNGCDLLICTPSMLVRLLQVTDFGVDLRRLRTFVFDDCERLSQVYFNEISFFLMKIKEMYKNRANKEVMVQFIASSRVWCDFMGSLAKKSPNSVVSIGAFQECVLYSKANTSVDFVKKENKIKLVLEFLKHIDTTKRSVIVCRSDDEVEELSKVVMKHKYVSFVCNTTMTVEELYNLSKSWAEYREPLLGPILICCDGNLTHLNVTDAHYLIHYSLPQLFSMFCKRFSVLNENYSSIFDTENKNVKIQVFLEESNVEQLPKILNFIKRCTENVPEFLNDVCEKILQEKDAIKGKNLVPICNNLLMLGECPDYWNCLERHAVFKEYDEPKEWMPRNGVVTFKILHYHSAVHFSARLLTNATKNNTKKYPQTYSMLSLKLGMFYSKESNRQLHGIPKIGDVCAVSVKQNFFARCEVLKILSNYNNGTPNYVLIKMIDEEKLERARDIHLFYLPDDLKSIETHVVQVRLAAICPKDKDITFSDLAKDQLKKITDKDEDLYLRGQVVLSVGNCIFVDTLDACQELTSLNETVVRYNFKKELLATHALTNPEHITKIKALCKDYVHEENIEIRTVPNFKKAPKPQWAHLEKNDLSTVYFASAENPGTFFVRHTKFESCMESLLQDIDKYVEGNPQMATDVNIGDIVLANFPDDDTYERARIEDVLDGDKVKCFFVDQGDWRDVLIKDLLEIPDKLILQMPFQAIECRLIGVKPAGDNWTEFGTNWFCDSCIKADSKNFKQLYVKYFTKDKADFTDSYKYGVAVIDTYSEKDVIINTLMIELNLAREEEEEMHFFNDLKLSGVDNVVDSESKTRSSITDESCLTETSKVTKDNTFTEINTSQALVPIDQPELESIPLRNIFMQKPIKSVPLVGSDSDSDLDRFDIVNYEKIAEALQLNASRTKRNLNTKGHVSNANFNVRPEITNSTHCISSYSSKNTTKKTINKNVPLISPLNVVKPQGVENGSLLSSTLDSDDLSSSENFQSIDKVTKTEKINPITEIDPLRKPKLVWRQNKSSVTIKIQLIGVECYDLEIRDISLKFTANVNNTDYGFDFQLYGVVESNEAYHSNKGQYVLIKLVKVIKKNWLNLTRDPSIKKWIVYDVDSIDTSSDEENDVDSSHIEAIKSIHHKAGQSDSEDDEFLDDINYEYNRDSD